MEIGTIFMAMVALISGCQLTNYAIQGLSKTFGKSKNKQTYKRSETKRDDWYCFFKLSSLYGSDHKNSKKNVDLQDVIRKPERISKQRRAQASRPRMQA